MIDFVISEHPGIINNMTTEELIARFEGKADLDIITLMVENQDELEVSYSKHKDVYRFDNVAIKHLLLEDDKVGMVSPKRTESDYMLNIDVDLKNNKFIVFGRVVGVGEILHLDIPEHIKIEQIIEFKSMQTTISGLGFKIEDTDDSLYLSLVCNNLNELKIENLSKALSVVENYTPYSPEVFDYM